MASDRYSVSCPSCEAQVSVRAASAGKKMECPKCKFKFVQPESPDDADDAPKGKPTKKAAAGSSKADKGGGGKAKGAKGKGDAAKKGSNLPLLIGVLVGVLALGGLGFGAFMLFGNGETKKPNNTFTPVAVAQGGGSSPGPSSAGSAGSSGDASTGASGGPSGATSGGAGSGGTTAAGSGGASGAPKVNVPLLRKANGVDVTNLLPNDTKSVWHVRMNELVKAEALRSTLFFERDMRALFAQSMPFKMEELDEFVQANVGADQDAFAVLRTNADIEPAKLYADKMVFPRSGDDGVVKGREFFLLKPNALIAGLEQGFNPFALFGADPAAARPARQGAAPQRYAVHLYDARTLVLAEKDVMTRYLSDLDKDGFPPFKSDYRDIESPKADPPTGGGPPVPAGSPGVPVPAGSSAAPSAVGSGGVGGGGPGAPPKPRRMYTSNPTFRTVDPLLKKAMNTLEDPEREPTAVAFSELVDQRALNQKEVRDLLQGQGVAALGLLSRVKVLGVGLTRLGRDKLAAAAYLDHLSDDDARKSVDESITPALPALALLYQLRTGDALAVVNGNTGDGSGGESGGTTPGGAAAGGVPSAGSPETPRPGRSGGGPRGVSGPAAGGKGDVVDPADEEVQAPRPGSSSGGRIPQPGGSGGAPSPIPGGSGTGPGGDAPPSGSRVTYTQSDTAVVIELELLWKPAAYDAAKAALAQTAGQLRGRMAMYGGAADPFRLAAKASEPLAKAGGALPLGALEREVTTDRVGGLQYPADERCGFFVALLPYMGTERAYLRSKVDEKRYAWHHPANRDAAVSWVPELLAPDYPDSAWRATSPVLPGVSLGATNYVGVAGLGLDAARLNPADPADAKRAGLLGYNFTSKKEDVTDGLSNTAYLAQVPPGLPRPWIAGGGATLVGVDDQGERPDAPFVVKRGDRKGTTLLMGDGSVRFLREGANPAVLRALATRAGGESIADQLDKEAPKEKPLTSELRTGR